MNLQTNPRMNPQMSRTATRRSQVQMSQRKSLRVNRAARGKQVQVPVTKVQVVAPLSPKAAALSSKPRKQKKTSEPRKTGKPRKVRKRK